MKNYIVVFLATSIITTLIYSLFTSPFLRIGLLCFTVLLYTPYVRGIKNIKSITSCGIILLIQILYLILQGQLLKLDLTEFIQPILISILYIYFIFQSSFITSNIRGEFNLEKLYTLVFIGLLLLLINPVNWGGNERLAGLLTNPNATAHTAMFFFPFALLGAHNSKRKIFLILFLLVMMVLTGSRSGLLALLLSACFVLFFFRKKLSLLSSILLLVVAYFISLYAVDILLWFLDSFSFHSSSRIFYSGYNGRDILFEIAQLKISESPLIGHGSAASKVELATDNVLGVHNGFYELAVRFGYIGLTIKLILLLAMLYNISNIRRYDYKNIFIVMMIIFVSLSTNSSIYMSFNFYFFYIILLYSILISYK